jgi:hypothetical protein
MHYDQADIERGEQGQLRSDLIQRLRRTHDISAELDNEDVVPVGPDVSQRSFESRDALGSIDAQMTSSTA